LFYIQPVIGLVLFLLCSAFHFGQTDCLEWGIKDNLKSFVLGLFVLSSILFSHLPETVVILNQMGVSTLSNLSSGLERVGYFPFLMAFPLLGYIKKWQFIQLVVLLLLLTKLPLLLAFGAYFVFQHSFNGWRQLSTQLRLTTAHLWIKALPFTLGGIGLFLVYYFFFDGKAWGQFFIFAAALSLPQVWFSFLTQKPMN
jgi:Brp/Blh family beta-carotene 15,15'-monooxygenase